MNPQQMPTVKHAASPNSPANRRRRRFWPGLVCSLSFLVLPVGRLCGGRWIKRLEAERLDRGLVLILPGIEGRSLLNISLMAGLLDAGLPYATEIVDWTTGRILLAIYHLRAWKRNRRAALQYCRPRGRVPPGLSGPPRVDCRALGGRGDGPADG